MWIKLLGPIAGMSALVGAASACAMNAPGPLQNQCRVIGADKLPPETGGSAALCAAIERAAASHAPAVKFTAEVTVVSASRLSARLVADGRSLPEQKFAISDRNLHAGSIQRFADAIGIALAQAAKD